MNWEPDPAASQRMETYNEWKLIVSNYRRRIWLSREILCALGFKREILIADNLNPWGYNGY